MGMIPVRDNRSMLERMQAGDLYQADDPEIAELAAGRARADGGVQRERAR